MKQHADNRDPDQRNVDQADPVRDPVGCLVAQHMHRANCESAACSDVALATRVREVIRMNVGRGVAGGQDVMDAMTAGAVSDLLHTAAPRQAMETVLIGGDLVCGQSVFLTQSQV